MHRIDPAKKRRHTAAPAAPTTPATIDDNYWRVGSLRFWIYCVVSSRTGEGLPGPAKQIKARTRAQLPKEIAGSLDSDTLSRVFQATDQGTCWFVKIEGIGWEPGARGGAKGVQAVQACLEWIESFRTRSTVQGNQLIYAAIETEITRRG